MNEKKYTKIYFRILPMEKMIWDYLKILNDHKTIYVRCLQQLAQSKENVVPTFWTFRTDHVFFNHTQKQIYEEVIPEVLDNILQGYDAIILAYGQTGTGKSLTVNGLYNFYEDRGLLPRLVSDVFLKLKSDAAKNNVKMCIQVSYVEFSRTTINDLLKAYPNHLSSLKDINKVKVRNMEEALKVIFRGEGRKMYADNSLYPSHSCSSIFTFHINSRHLEMQDNSTSKVKLHIVDLAGADTVGNFTCLFKKSQEIGAANLAKTQLEQFFLVLCSDIPEQIKIKQKLNPMIHYLGDSLNKTSVLRIIGHIRVSREDLLITISMLRFGELIGGLKSTRCQIKIEKDISQERVENLQKELDKLKLESQYNAILMHQDLSKSLNEERFAHIERTVNEYLQNKITQLTLFNVCDINIALEIMKMICKKHEEGNVKKDDSVTKTRRVSSNTTHSKSLARSSRGSNKTSLSDQLTKKASDEKSHQQKARSSSATIELKTASKDKVVQETASKTRSKTSSLSLMKRSSISKRKSTSSASTRDRSKSKSNESVLKPQIPPEYSEAWNLYLNEKNDDYTCYIKLFEKNETAAKNVYRTYLNELDKLNEIRSSIEKYKNNLLMAKMTREFQQAYKYGIGTTTFSEFEGCCMRELEKAEKEQLERQEIILKCQTEVKTFINICKDVKKDLESHFNEFCQEKYNILVPNLETSEATTVDIIQALDKEEEQITEHSLEVQNEEEKMFERFRHLIEIEKRKKKLYQMRHREWLT